MTQTAQDRWVTVHDGWVTGRIECLDGKWYYEVPKPRRWHRCRPQTRGWIGLNRMYRCPCGAVGYDGGIWIERNSR